MKYLRDDVLDIVIRPAGRSVAAHLVFLMLDVENDTSMVNARNDTDAGQEIARSTKFSNVSSIEDVVSVTSIKNFVSLSARKD